MKQRAHSTLRWSIALIAPLALIAAPVGAVAEPHRAPPLERQVPSLPGPLFGVDALSSDNIWAVGSRPNPQDPDEDRGLAEHWDGTKWTEVSTPPFSDPLTGGLVDVSMADASHGFAVGSFGQRSFRDRQIAIERWDGTKWTRVSAPDASFNDILTGVATLSPNDAWAVGAYSTGGTGRGHPLAEHWNGTAWKIVALPDVGPAELNAVVAIASDDVWAVGWAGGRTLAMHWDGNAWSRVASPNRGAAVNRLADVDAAGPNDVWAAGTVESGQPFVGKTVAIHWNGKKWSRTPSDTPSSGDTVTGVAAIGSSTAWMVGSYWPTAFDFRGLADHLTPGSSERVRVGKAILEGVAGVADDNVWAVGGTGIYHWDGSRWLLVVRG
jgi:hypothetical protein